MDRKASAPCDAACTQAPKQLPFWIYRFEFLLLITRPAGDSPYQAIDPFRLKPKK